VTCLVSRRDQAPARVRFEPLEQQRAHEYVAEQIRRQIVLRLIPTGQVLPPERDLATIFGVGRATVQQAIRLLVEDGMVESRRGRYRGGNFVVGPDDSGLGMDTLLERLRRRSAEIKEALAYRSAVEPEAARLAALNRSRDQLRALRRANAAAAAAEADVEFMQRDTELHLALADASGNRFFRQAIEDVRLTLNDAMIALPDSNVWHERSAAEHEAILRAVTDRESDGASAAMRTHIDHTAQSVVALLSALAGRPKTSKRSAVDRRRAAG
jgi:GntR family transcriptional regulator, transcriptional repressor for pyruvate dehydrogenase complex